MAVKTKEDILTSLKAVIGENSGDDAIGILEDVSDTFDDYNSRVNDSTDWKKKYEDNDAEWRQKYRDRFYGAVDDNLEKEIEENIDEPSKPMSYDDLFKKE